MWAGDLSQRRIITTHRAAWILTNGPIPVGLCVCHRCDNPTCVNPAHLFLGTHQDNMRDAIAKGRFKFPVPRHGTQNNLAKLTWPFVKDIRAAYAAGESLSDLSRRLGYARSTLREVVNGRNWRDGSMEPRPKRQPTRKLSNEEVSEMRRLHSTQGLTGTALGVIFGVSQSQASRILKGTAHVA
jgi:hypothetical protein